MAFNHKSYRMNLITTLFLCTVLNSPVIAQDWTWMHGEDSPNQYGVYGTQGVSGPLNTPGGRSGAVSWKDLNGNVWLFGGNGFGSMVSNGLLGDLWKYDVTTREWTWVNGTGIANQPGLYGTMG